MDFKLHDTLQHKILHFNHLERVNGLCELE